MTNPKILVTGATGRTGCQVAMQLLAAGYPVRAYARRKDARTEALAAGGAEIAVGDLADPLALRAAMQGVQRAYFLPPFDPYMIQAACAFAIAAREARLESMVALSQWLASPEHPALATRQHWLADRLFAMLPDTAVTIVNPGFFADFPYLFLLKYAAHLGVLPFPARGTSRNAPPSVDDIARVAVAALKEPAAHAGRTYRPTGPDMLSVREMAAIIGKVLGRRVRHVRLPMWMFYRAARMDGLDPFLLSQLGSFFADHDRGAFEFGGPTAHVLETTGQAAESFEAVARRLAAHPGVRRTAGAFLRTFVSFMSVPMRPGFEPDRFVRTLRMPAPGRPVLSADSAFWREEHAAAPGPSAEAGKRSGEPAFTRDQVLARV